MRGLRVQATDPVTNQPAEVKLYNKSYAVIIGIDKYPGLPPDRQLTYAVHDAQGIEATLKRLYKFDRIVTLYNEQATKDRILEVLTEELPKEMTSEDSLFVFWAGHGNQEKNSEGDLGYLIPYDGSLAKIRTNLTMADIRDTISKKVPAKHVLYVMDACYSGLLTATRAVDNNPRRDLNYLKEITKERVRQVLTAVGKDQEVLDGGPKGHSVFTGRLIEILEEAGDYKTANEIQAIIRKKVYGDARARNHEQKPDFGTLYGSGDFVFIPSVEQKVKDNQAELARLEAELKKITEQEEQARKFQDDKKRREAEIGRKAAEARLKAEQLKKEQLAEEQRRRQADEAARARFEADQQKKEAELDMARQAETIRLAALKVELEKRKTTVGVTAAGAMTIKVAVSEIKRLNSEIYAVEATFDKELNDGRKRIIGRYDIEIARLKQESIAKKQALKKDEFETQEEFKERVTSQTRGYAARISELEDRRQEEQEALVKRIGAEKAAQTAGLRAAMKQLAEQEYPLPPEFLAVDLGQYDLSRQAFPVSITSNQASPIKLAMNGMIPLPREAARLFKQQYTSGLVRPDFSAIAGKQELGKVALANDAESSVLVYEDGEFITVAERERRAEQLAREQREQREQRERERERAAAEARAREEARQAEAERRLVGEFVRLPGGCFYVGDAFGDGQSDEKPVHEVCVDGFMMGKYEVTQGQWQAVMGNNPSKFSSCGDNCPVEQVSWNDIQEFVSKLNRQTGRNFRLPTEAEWEYAARSGGKKEKYAGTSSDSELNDYAWYDKNSGNKTHPVGEKRPNGLGFYDMSGNVWEWCADWYDGNYYKNSPRQNPTGVSSGSSRVDRGGSWINFPRSVRAAYRSRYTPVNRNLIMGFRLVAPQVR